MSILIKGMEMPDNCIYCPVVNGEYGGCLIDGKGHGDPNKPIDCPLIEVPTPHGRLIDADAFPYPRVEWEDIVNAPTVIEAEVEE